MIYVEDLIDRLCGAYREDTPGLVVGVVKDLELVTTKAYGCANLNYGIPITGDTVFHLCSMAKQFTAACVALLEESGDLTRDDRIRDHFPRLPEYFQDLTVAHLLHMTGGLQDIYSLAGCVCGIGENYPFSERQAWQFATAAPGLIFKPGERWAYNNTGYFLLAQLIEKVTSQKLSRFAKENIFDVLGMNDTFLRDDMTKIIPNMAMGYKDYGQVHIGNAEEGYASRGDRFSEFVDPMEVPGAGQLWSTLNDLLKWDKNFYENRLGKGRPEWIAKLTTPGRLTSGKSCGYGYGLNVREMDGDFQVCHGGWAGGYSSYIYRNMTQRISVIALGNHTDIFEEIEVWNGRGMLEKIMDAVLKKPVAKGLPDAEKVEYPAFGRYYDPERSVIWKLSSGPEGKLIVDGYGQDRTLSPDGSGRYRTEEGEEVLVTKEAVQMGGVKYHSFYKGGLARAMFKPYEGNYQNQSLSVEYTVEATDRGIRVRNRNGLHRLLDLDYSPILLDGMAERFGGYACDTFLAEARSIGYFFISFLKDESGEIKGFVYRDDDGSDREAFLFLKT